MARFYPNMAVAARRPVEHTGQETARRQTMEAALPPAKTRRKKVVRKPKAKAPAAETGGASAGDGRSANARSTGGDWGELADKAARKVRELAEKAMPKAREFADKAMPKAKEAGESAKKMAVDVSEGLDGAFAKVSDQARDLMAKGQHTRVRIKFRGKQIAELPIAVVAAAEVASFWWFGPLRLVLGHFVGKAVLDVEFVSNADQNVAKGRAFLADGELDKAITEFDKALAMDRRCAGALLGKGIALKLRGDRAGAKKWFEEAEECDPRGEAGREARRHLDNL
jgi:tetratricopeptide (TPR) repeat protein